MKLLDNPKFRGIANLEEGQIIAQEEFDNYIEWSNRNSMEYKVLQLGLRTKNFCYKCGLIDER